VYYVANDAYFGRKGIYDDPETGEGYPDNAERFIFFQLAALELLRRTGFRPDVVHCHDHQAALVPSYLKLLLRTDPFFAGAGSILTIHNLGYQGIFPPETMDLAGFPPGTLSPLSAFEFFGKMNFMKAGISHADLVTTVSPTYAREICEPEHGFGLEGVLRQRGADLVGILNGIDPGAWDPASDPLLPARYTASDPSGKAACRDELRRRMALPDKAGALVIGMVTRLAEQKGLDLLDEAMGRLMSRNVQLVVLGTGQARFHALLREASARWPARLSATFGFSEELAHLIEAGADAFLMPSRYEPCGLNQMYSLRYGTVPIVRATGGLADTVVDADRDSAAGNGFSFGEYSAAAMLNAVDRAIAAFRDRERWLRLIRSGMAADFSWAASAAAYEKVYERAAASAARVPAV
jgi:starch synthase